MATVRIGNTAVREAVESGRITRAETDSYEIVRKGPYADLSAAIPAKGTELITGYKVDQSVLERGRGGMGTLTISLVTKGATSIIPVPEGAVESTIETDMAQVEKPITANPRLVAQGSGTTQTVVDEVAAWRNSPQQRQRLYQIPLADLKREAEADKDEDWVKLTGEALKVAQKIAKGIEAYLAFYPVVTRTSVYTYRPNPENVGKREAPPVTVGGSYVYLKTADRTAQNSRKQYTRTEQWTGADYWDEDLYP